MEEASVKPEEAPPRTHPNFTEIKNSHYCLRCFCNIMLATKLNHPKPGPLGSIHVVLVCGTRKDCQRIKHANIISTNFQTVYRSI